ncbi:MAG TPA: hypothetical protein VF188_18315, partial [Longimicrobiales bacterium]
REVEIVAERTDGTTLRFRATIRIDTPQELLYYRHGGILQFVLRQLLGGRIAPIAFSPTVEAAPQRVPGAPRDDAVEKGSIKSFPASDPPAY